MLTQQTQPSTKARLFASAASAALIALVAAPESVLAAGDTIITTNRPIPYVGDRNAGNPPVGADRTYGSRDRPEMKSERSQMGAMRRGPTGANKVHYANGIPFACTGVAETKANPRWQRFPLRLVYASGPRGALLSNVRTRIQDRRGATVLQVQCTSSPWLVAGLKPGHYRVTATSNSGVTRTATFRVPASGQKRVIVRFPRTY